MAVKTNTDYNDFTFNRSKHTNAKWIERSFFSSWTVLLILPTNCINMNEHPNLSNEEYSCWNKQYSHSNQQYKLQKVNLGTTAQNVNQTKVTDTWPLHCLTKHLNQVSYGHRSYERNLSLKKSGLQRGLIIAYLICCYCCYCFESKDLEEKKKK